MKTASRELFELCKQVYEATGWDDTQNGYYNIDGKEPLLYDKDNFDIHKEPWWGQMAYLSPAYTSDYLLEKLPQSLKHKNDQISVFNDSKGWSAKLNINFIDDDDIYHHRELNDSYGHNTPLKALLKLTLKLHEEGLL